MNGIVLPAVLAVFAVIFAGVWLRRGGVLDAASEGSLMRLLIHFLTPCLILDAVVDNPALMHPANALVSPAVGFASIAAGVLAGLATAGAARIRHQEGRTFAYATALYNYGFIPIPLGLAMFGKETVGVLMVFNIGVEAALWLFAGLMLSGEPPLRGLRRAVNPPLLTLCAALALNTFLPGITPEFARKAVALVGQAAVPLALILSGAVMADQLRGFLELRGGRVIGLSCLLRLGLLPLLFVWVAREAPFSLELKRVLVLQAAMPAAVFPVVLARLHDASPATALRVLVATSLGGLITIPLWLRFGLRFVGIE
jgi:predicted permease